MNKKFLSVILFSALMVGTAGTFTSCKDYDDDIDNLQEQITSNKDAIAALESQIKSGEWVSGVTSTDNGIVVTLGNGTSYTITNGEAGKDGVTPKIAVNNDKIQVSYDNGTTWTDLISLEDLKGEAGDAAETPIFSVGEDGHIYVQYGKDGEKQDLGVSTGGIYYVEDGAKLTIHIPNKEGVYEDIVLPRAAAISSIKAVTVRETDDKATIAEGATVNLVYGVAADKGEYFDGTPFAKGDILLPTKEANGVLNAQVNPTIADATVYKFQLVDSKGFSIFNLNAAVPNMTENALTTKAPTANKGIYDMAISFAAGVTTEEINKVKGQAFAIATKDAYDNEVLSAYDVTATATKAGTSSLTVKKATVEAEINQDFDLSACVDMENVIDVKYFIDTDQTAAADAAKAKITGTNIKGEVAGKTVVVSVKYLTATGKVDPTATKKISVKFINPAIENAFTQELVLKADNSKNVLVFDLTSLFDNTTTDLSSYKIEVGYAKFTVDVKDANGTVVFAKGTEAKAITTGKIVSGNATEKPNGYYKHTLTYSVNNTKVVPGTYEAEVTYGSSPKNTVKLTLIVKEDATSYDFKPLPLYFNGNAAVAYGTPVNDKINYNLKGLFGVEDWTNVTFSETVPAEYEKDGVKWTANKWIVDAEAANSGDIIVDKVAAKTGDKKTGNFGGAYEPRSLKAIYTPYGNTYLTVVEYDFTLTIKSAVFEGTLDYVKYDTKAKKYVAGTPKEISVADEEAKITLKGDEIRGVTKTNVEYLGNSEADKFTKAGVETVSIALDDTAKKYLNISAADFTNEITLTPIADVTAPATTLTCNIVVSVVDEWGKTKTVNVPVVLK